MVTCGARERRSAGTSKHLNLEGVTRRFGANSISANRNPWTNSKNEKEKKEQMVMNNKFDELAKGLAQSVTRRQAFKKFSVGLAGMALACFGLADTAKAGSACRTCMDYCLNQLRETMQQCKDYCACPCRGCKF